MSENSKPGIFSRLIALFSRVSFESDDESDDLGTRAMKRARKQQRRRDEFVTKRELDVLRKVRRERDTPLPVRSKPNLVQPAGAMNTPAGSAKEDTLRKINEIERMMSVDIKGTPKAQTDKEKEAQNRAFLPTQPMSASVQRPVVVPRTSTPSSTPELTESQRIAAAFAKTDMMTRPMPRGGVTTPNMPGAYNAGATGNDYLNSMLMGQTQMMSAMDVQELSSDPVLEEASIHFANAEYDEAELTLKNAVAPTGPGYRSLETWRALFDLYRATGDQAKFESVGLDFVSLFDTSAPNWFSLSGDTSAKPATNASAGPAAYVCPARVDAYVANQLQQFVEMRLMSGGVVALDFSKLQSINPEAAENLAKSLVSLNATTAKVAVVEPDRFSDNCRALTVASDKSVPQAAWSLRLEWLRLLGLQDDFETLALDYCVAYEVSPPSWVKSKANYAAGAVGSASASGAVSMDSSSSWSLAPLSVSSTLTQGTVSMMDASGDAPNRAELSGEITAGNVVITPDIATAAQQPLVAINCAKLKRIDFASAGTLLNWVLEQVGSGKQVQFYDAHRLIAAFFAVIGITGHARVSLRRD